MLLHEVCHLTCQIDRIHDVPSSSFHDLKFFLPFMGNENVAKGFCISIDKEAELCQDGEPDVVRTDDERAVLVVCLDHGVDKSVALWNDVQHGFGTRRER